MANLKILTLNINGRKDGLKRFESFEYLKNQKADIFCLQEPHTLESDEHLWHLIWRGKCYFCHLTASCGGVSFLLNP